MTLKELDDVADTGIDYDGIMLCQLEHQFNGDETRVYAKMDRFRKTTYAEQRMYVLKKFGAWHVEDVRAGDGEIIVDLETPDGGRRMMRILEILAYVALAASAAIVLAYGIWGTPPQFSAESDWFRQECQEKGVTP